MVKQATLESQFDPKELAELLNPQEHVSTPPDNPNLRLLLLNYVSLIGHSQEAYKATQQNTQWCFPDIELLLHWQVKRWARLLSGLLTWEHHMCVNSCLGFTGPYSNLDHCPKCGESWYNQQELVESEGRRKVPWQVFTTFPIGPQIQARWKNPCMAKDMFYQWEKTEELLRDLGTDKPLGIFDDILSGRAYLDLVDKGKIGKYDTVLMLSIDGAQLYQNKQSGCWIYIWILVDLAPDK